MQKWCKLMVGFGVLTVTVMNFASPAGASECAGRERSADDLTVEQAEALVDCQIDRERRARDVRPLRRDERLSEAAARHSRAMVSAGVFAHVLPNGPWLSERVRRTGYLEGRGEWLLSEVLAWATLSASSPARLVQAWLDSRTHRDAVLADAYDELGIGIVRGTPRNPDATGFTVAAVLAG